MKRFLLMFSGFIVLGIFLGVLFINKSSYVLLTFENFAFETSLWFFLITLCIVYFLFNFLLALVIRVYRPGKRFESWAHDRRVAASKRDFYQAIIDFETGTWDKALKKFKAATVNLDRPLVAYLYAARTAQKLGRRDLREEMLHEAAQIEPEASLAIGLVRAELLIEENLAEDARKLLEGLKKASPSNHRVSSLLETLPAPRQD